MIRTLAKLGIGLFAFIVLSLAFALELVGLIDAGDERRAYETRGYERRPR